MQPRSLGIFGGSGRFFANHAERENGRGDSKQPVNSVANCSHETNYEHERQHLQALTSRQFVEHIENGLLHSNILANSTIPKQAHCLDSPWLRPSVHRSAFSDKVVCRVIAVLRSRKASR